MKRSRLLMLLMVAFLVALPVAAGGLDLSYDLLMIDLSETKIFTGEELAVMSYSKNVAAPAVINIQSLENPSITMIIADIGFEMDNYSYINCYGGILNYSGCF